MKIKLTTESIRYIGLFETITGAVVKDCILDAEKIVFVVKEGDAGLAIGKQGMNIKHLQNAINKKVEVVEYSSNPAKFMNNIFRPARMNNTYKAKRSDGKEVIHISPETDRGLVKTKLKQAKIFLKRYFDIGEIIVH